MASLKSFNHKLCQNWQFCWEVLKFSYMKISPWLGDDIIVEIFKMVHWFDKRMHWFDKRIRWFDKGTRWFDKRTRWFMKRCVDSRRVALFLVLIKLCKKNGQSYMVQMIFLKYVSVDKIYKSSKIFTTIYIK